MTDDGKVKLLRALNEVYAAYEKEVGEFMLECWLHAFDNYDVDVVVAALVKYVETPDVCRFMPKPGDIIGLLRDIPQPTPLPPQEF